MTLFLMVWLALVAAAAGLAVGALRGRPLPGGSCAARAASGRTACESCLARPRTREPAAGGSPR